MSYSNIPLLKYSAIRIVHILHYHSMKQALYVDTPFALINGVKEETYGTDS